MTFLASEIIRRKRDGARLSLEEIEAFAAGLSSGDVEESQIAAFAMAVYFQGLDPEETAALTLAMANSGSRLDWPGAERPVLDKHSTGGVGDKVSLILAPLLAACGAAVPMIAGRGLGHTGGTLDKLDAIPGYDTRPSLERIRKAVATAHCAIVGQTAELAPADRRFYAVRDVTATVESIPLITASILSKKIAAGLDGLVLDVKFGSGAFMPELDRAEALARSLVETGTAAGLSVRALLTDMNQPLGGSAGNGLEVLECISFLKGEERDPRLLEVTLALGAELMEMSGLAESPDVGRQDLLDALEDGRAAESFQRMVAALGGPGAILERPEKHIAAAPVARPVPAPREGFLAQIDCRQIGLAVLGLGGGRKRSGDAIDHRVGFSQILPLGWKVEKGEPLASVHAANEADATAAIERYLEAVTLAEEARYPRPLIAGRVLP